MGAFSKLFSRWQNNDAATRGNERRACFRQAVDCLAVAVVGGRQHTVNLENISASGAFLSPRLEAAKGSVLTLRIPEAGVSMLARIAHHGQRGTGVYFDDSASAERVVEKFAAA